MPLPVVLAVHPVRVANKGIHKIYQRRRPAGTRCCRSWAKVGDYATIGQSSRTDQAIAELTPEISPLPVASLISFLTESGHYERNT